jgi:catechol 2,3-dioxygenase-like lactoylglutathione lyase family enzyme
MQNVIRFNKSSIKILSMSKFCHLSINVSNLKISSEFYDIILKQLNWQKEINEDNLIGYINYQMSQGQWLFFEQTSEKYLKNKFHRKRTGLNHLAFYVDSKEEVEKFAGFLKDNNIEMLYGGAKEYPEYGKGYYAVYFEDPDRIKLEVCYYPL